jgi:hypothetical protein
MTVHDIVICHEIRDLIFESDYALDSTSTILAPTIDTEEYQDQ